MALALPTPGEPLSRFIFHKNQFKKGTLEVTAAAFLPNRKNNETSVFRTGNLTSIDIWDIGINHVEALRKKADPKISLKARGDIKTQTALSQGLNVIPETSSHPLHANLTNWPPDESAQNMAAVELARAATLSLRPEIS